MDANLPFITRQDILKFPFPYKLWLIVNVEYCDFFRWNRDGTVVLLDLVALEEYLNSTRSIFKIKNSSNFLKLLVEFKFERLNSTPEAEEDLLLQYKNENFQRHRLDLLAKVRKHTYQIIGQFPKHNFEENESNATNCIETAHAQCTSIPQHVSERMLGDLCFMFHGGLSNIKRSRLRFQTILHFNNEKRILKEKLESSESAKNFKLNPDISIRSASGLSSSDEDQVIELPVELFENPHDSVLSLSDEFIPEYAGYYGNCSKDQIINFFGEYLPMYEYGSLEVKKIVTNNNTSCNINPLLINTEVKALQYYSPNVDENSKENISTSTGQNNIYNFNISSNLEPIFLANEDYNNIDLNNDCNSVCTMNNFNSTTNEDDISMEEFLKFKDIRSANVSTNSQHLTEVDNEYSDSNSISQQQENTFPQMPTSFKMELSEDVKENEANFRNFFSQYRASLNLLYDR